MSAVNYCLYQPAVTLSRLMSLTSCYPVFFTYNHPPFVHTKQFPYCWRLPAVYLFSLTSCELIILFQQQVLLFSLVSYRSTQVYKSSDIFTNDQLLFCSQQECRTKSLIFTQHSNIQLQFLPSVKLIPKQNFQQLTSMASSFPSGLLVGQPTTQPSPNWAIHCLKVNRIKRIWGNNATRKKVRQRDIVLTIKIPHSIQRTHRR